MKTLSANQFLENPKWRHYPLLDVRSPGEYAAGHLPDAASLPLFTDAERAEVGTLYKQVSADDALLRGLEIAGSKMRWLVEEARRLSPEGMAVVHCWRGGQRSGSVGWLLERAGMDVYQLQGGYKAARKVIRHYLKDSPHEFRVLSGPTGSGKTDVLREMALLGASVIDLEGLANHKGSSFGALGEAKQPGSEQFENDLYQHLHAIPDGNTVWLEDESRLIGHVYLPDEFYTRLTQAPVTLIQQPIEWRINRLVAQYGQFSTAELSEAFSRIRKRLGGLRLQQALEALNNGDLATAASIALLYYDKAYGHYSERRQAPIAQTVHATSSDPRDVAEQILLTNPEIARITNVS